MEIALEMFFFFLFALGLNALYRVQIGDDKTFLERDDAYRIEPQGN